MVKKKKNESIKIDTVISEGVVFKGTFSTTDSIIINGTIVGNCDFSAMVIIGETGKILGDVSCKNIRIEGLIQGNISANGCTELLSTAKVAGDIETGTLIIDENGYFNGRCIMSRSEDVLFEAADREFIDQYLDEKTGSKGRVESLDTLLTPSRIDKGLYVATGITGSNRAGE